MQRDQPPPPLQHHQPILARTLKNGDHDYVRALPEEEERLLLVVEEAVDDIEVIFLCLCLFVICIRHGHQVSVVIFSANGVPPPPLGGNVLA